VRQTIVFFVVKRGALLGRDRPQKTMVCPTWRGNRGSALLGRRVFDYEVIGDGTETQAGAGCARAGYRLLHLAVDHAHQSDVAVLDQDVYGRLCQVSVAGQRRDRCNSAGQPEAQLVVESGEAADFDLVRDAGDSPNPRDQASMSLFMTGWLTAPESATWPSSIRRSKASQTP